MLHEILQSKCFSLYWICRDQRSLQSVGIRGKLFREVGAEANSWADLAEKIPLGTGVQIQRSKYGFDLGGYEDKK